MRLRIRIFVLVVAVPLVCATLAFSQPATHQAYSPESRQTTASAFVPMDSYVYPLFDHLSARSGIDSSFLGIRPWTRKQCAALVAEAIGRVEGGIDAEAVAQLEKEFFPELQPNGAGARTSLDEVYVRTLGESGPPLTDIHFGQTLYNDFGRNSREGMNVVVGASATQLWGPIVAHVRAESEHAAEPTRLPPQAEAFINRADDLPAQNASPPPDRDQFRLVEAYAGVRMLNVNVTVGKQSLWWGPSPSSALLFSTNADNLYMVRAQSDKPLALPWIFSWMGPVRWDAFFGRMAGHRYPEGPMLHGQKISFKPTRNLELGVSRTVTFAGAGRPLTVGSFWDSFISVGDNRGSIPGTTRDVGDRRGGFDFVYRLPKLRNSVTLYGDFFTDDDPSPLAAPHRSAMIPGLYIARFPHAPKLNLRMEAFVTAQDSTSSFHGHFFYINNGYKDGYTNNGQWLGSWIGRDSLALMATSRYWISATSSAAVSYRNVKLARDFVPGGGTQNSVRTTFETGVGRQMRISSFVQWERWTIPMLRPLAQNNLTASVQLSYQPTVHRK